MKITHILIAFAVLLSAPLALAEETCKSTPYKLLDGTVSIGTNHKTAESKVRRAFGGKGLITTPKENLILVKFLTPHNNLDEIVYMSIGGKITRILFSYHNDFQAKFGGLVETFKVLMEKLKGTYGDFDDRSFDKAKGKATFIWPRKGGASLTLIATEPNGLVLRVDCDALEDELKAKQAGSANFGF